MHDVCDLNISKYIYFCVGHRRSPSGVIVHWDKWRQVWLINSRRWFDDLLVVFFATKALSFSMVFRCARESVVCEKVDMFDEHNASGVVMQNNVERIVDWYIRIELPRRDFCSFIINFTGFKLIVNVLAHWKHDLIY